MKSEAPLLICLSSATREIHWTPSAGGCLNPAFEHQNHPIKYLVGGFNPSEKYEFVSWDDEIPNIWKVIIHSCSSHHQAVIINHD